MADPFRLQLIVQHADGTESRWGPDELDAADIPTNLQCSDTLPGGFEELSCDLLRRIDLAAPDQNVLDRVLLLGPGNEVVWEGRFQQFPRETADGYTVSPGAEGYSAHLRDNTSFREIYVDRELGQFQESSLDRQAAYGGKYGSDYTITVAAGGLAMNGTDAKAITGAAATEWWYTAPAGVTIAKVAYKGSESNTTNVEGPTIYVGDDDFTSPSTSVVMTLDNTLRTGTFSTARRYAMLRARATATHTPAAGAGLQRAISILALYGNHSLTLYDNGTEPQGVIASDVLANALARAAPLLNFTTGTAGTIATTSIVFSHLVFRELTTVEEVVKKVNAVHLYPWFVWEDRTFYFQPDDNSTPWTVRLGDGAHLKDDGPSGQNVINQVFVQYTDPTRRSRTAGPVGSGCDTEDSSLEDTDPNNPANSHGYTTKSETIALSSVADDDFAVAVGAIYLAERAKQQRRGEAQITGMAQHPTMGMRPCWQIRAGDYIQFVDTLDDSISEPRRIIRKVYDHNQRTATLSLDSTPYTLDALLELLDAELVSVS